MKYILIILFVYGLIVSAVLSYYMKELTEAERSICAYKSNSELLSKRLEQEHLDNEEIIKRNEELEKLARVERDNSYDWMVVINDSSGVLARVRED